MDDIRRQAMQRQYPTLCYEYFCLLFFPVYAALLAGTLVEATHCLYGKKSYGEISIDSLF